MAAAKRQRAYTIEEKLRVVERLNNGETQANISRELGIAASTLRGWAKNETKLQEFVQSVDKLLQLRGMIDFVRSTRAKCQKQNKITSYMRRTSPPSPTSTDEPNFI